MTGRDDKRAFPGCRIRVLYLVYWLEAGGLDTWLRNVVARRPNNLEVFVACYRMNDEVATYYTLHRCEIRRLPRATQLLRYLLTVYRECRGLQPQIVHSNNYHAGFELWAAKLAGVPVRIAHSHSVLSAHWDQSLPTRLALRMSRSLIQGYATHGLACSEQAAEGMFGGNWRTDSRWRVLHCGVDLREFGRPVKRGDLVREFGLPRDAVILAHVGRLAAEKNHDFIIKLAPKIIECVPQAYFVFVGEGEQRSRLEQLTAQMGLAERFRLPGTRSDIPRLMTSLFDVLLLPSFYEGLPHVVVEAQAAGLPVVASDAVPKEAVVIPELVTRLPLSGGTELWVEAIVKAVETRGRVSREVCLASMEKSDFNAEVSAARLFSLYEEACSSFGDSTFRA